jgi:multidrug efflux pump subunit AcrA (membrane-fusion protein)
MVDVYEQDLAWVKPGTTARIELPYAPGEALTGRVDYLYDALDPMTRTLKARVTVPNPGLHLKPGMYATVTLEGGRSDTAPVVPEDALIRSGSGGVLILAVGSGRFRPVEVVPGATGGGRVQILAGLSGGERVVTSAQFLIDSEARLKSAIGAMQGHAHGAGVE